MRPLMDHLSPEELAGLAERKGAPVPGSPERTLEEHLAICPECRGLFETLQTVRRLGRQAARDAAEVSGDVVCPPFFDWLEFASGHNAEKSEEMLSHAARCSTCAETLKEAMTLISQNSAQALRDSVEDGTAAPDAVAGALPLAGLRSSTREWQQQMAARMAAADAAAAPASVPAAGAAKTNVIAFPRRRSSWWRYAAAAAALMVVSLAGWMTSRIVHPADARLLAESYNRQRLLPLRIPGGDPVPLDTGQRGTQEPPPPAELDDLSSRAKHHLEREPGNAYWHQIMGEIELLRMRGAPARSELEFARSLDPALPNLLPDLAASWFEIGEANSASKAGAAADYGNAIDLYERELKSLSDGASHPTAPELLHYNLAICFERLSHNDKAIQELNAALSTERSPAWKAAIQAEINRLRSSSASPLADPLQTDGYEAALSGATALLPRWQTSDDARRTITAAAALGLRHGDRWIADWIAAPHNAASQQGDAHLASAAEAAVRGEAESSLADSAQALAFYRRAGNRAGELRALYAETYAYQRLGRDTECLRSAAQVQAGTLRARYLLLHARARLDESMCDVRGGDLAGAERSAVAAGAEAGHARLPQFGLYVFSMKAAMLSGAGRPSAAWQMDVSGLAQCAQIHCNAVRQYAFVFDEVQDAEQLALPYTAAALMQEAVAIAARGTDQVTYAYALETEAGLLARVGDFAASLHAFDEAERIAHSGHQAALAGMYQTEWQMDRAEILSRQGRPADALDVLHRNEQAVLSGDYTPAQAKFYRQASIAELALQRNDEALAHAAALVGVSEKSLPQLISTADRERWMRENQPDYAQLVKVHLQRGDSAGALRSWERFRSAPFAGRARTDAAAAPVIAAPASGPVLVIAQLDDRFVGWLLQPPSLAPVRVVTLGSREQLQETATEFYRLCASPDAALPSVHALGAVLYNRLFAPLLPAGLVGRTLWLDLDPALAIVPAAALTTPDGRWLADSARVALLPPWWTLNATAAMSEPLLHRGTHAVFVSGFTDNAQSEQELASLRNAAPALTQMEGSTAQQSDVVHSLQQAELFHFSGHATNSDGLLLAAASAQQRSWGPDSLRGVHLTRCRIAVLAACNTTAADPDRKELQTDMRSAMLQAGAGTVVASLWDVDDRSTGSLMGAMYAGLAQGAALTSSLQQAQRQVRERQQWQHPYYWASFEVFTN